MASVKKPKTKPKAPPEAPVTPPGPHFFREILGQERVLAQLRGAARKERLAHAYLFLGPEGVGRASTARAMAAALNCAQPLPDGDGCGECGSCRRLAAGTDPDFLAIYPTSEGLLPQIKIEQIREFRRLTAYPPLGGGWRVALIKPAEALNDASANALLKTLEEPPPQHLLVLTATVENNLFPTIVSRCQKLSFAPLPLPVVTRELTRRRGLPPEAAALLAALSGGSLGRALSLDPEELARQRSRMLADLEQLPQASAGAVLDWAQKLSKERGELEQFLLLAQMWYRDLLLWHFGSPERLLAHQDCREDLERERRRGAPATWFAHFTALGAAQRHLQANLNMELTLDILGFRLQRQGSGHELR